MAFDFKKECKELYRPSAKPSIVTVPPMSYVAVRGKGNPNAEGGEYQKASRSFTEFPIPSRCRRRVTATSMGTSTSWCLRLKGSGGKNLPAAKSTTRTKKAFVSSPAFVFPISSPRKSSIGPSRKPPPRKRLISQQWSFWRSTRDYAYSACTRVPTITSRQPSTPCMNLPQSRDSSQIFPRAVCITRSTCPTHENALPRN